MTVTALPFLSGPGASFSESEWRETFGALFLDGVIKDILNEYAVTAGSGMTVNVDTGRAIAEGLLVVNDASAAVTITTADGTHDRIDVIAIHVNLTGSTDSDGVSARSAALIAIAGTPAASPTTPNLTRDSDTWEVPLAQVLVPAGASSSGSFTISTDGTPNLGHYRNWTGARNRQMSVFSGTVVSGGMVTANHGLGAKPNYVQLTPAGTTPVAISGQNLTSTTVDVYCTNGTSFWGLAFRDILNDQ